MKIYENIKEIRLKKSINQQVIADALCCDVAVVSNIENNKRELKVSELEIISNVLGCSVIDLITYPKKYVEKTNETEPIEAILQIKLSKDKREKVLQIVFGDDNLNLIEQI